MNEQRTMRKIKNKDAERFLDGKGGKNRETSNRHQVNRQLRNIRWEDLQNDNQDYDELMD